MTVDFLQVRSPSCFSLWWLRIYQFPFLILSYLSSSPGGPVPQVGVTITMNDELLNGTNRVVLDGVMTEKECERILQLATVSSDGERVRPSMMQQTATLSPSVSSPL